MRRPPPTPGLPFDAAMRELLDGTGLTYEFINDHLLTIIALPPAPARPETVGPDSSRAAPLTAEPVLITGTHLTELEPVGTRVIRIEREEIRRRGYATVAEAMGNITQAFGAANAAPALSGGASSESLHNASRGIGLNLRGLGASSTLVLLDGRRLASGASEGRFVDISMIPLEAVERIEIVPDGASAIYGADAIGGVVNLILRNDYHGAETQMRFGAGTAGEPQEHQVAQSLGTAWSTGRGLLSLEYYAHDALPGAERPQTRSSDLTGLGGDNFDMIADTLFIGAQTWAIPRAMDGHRRVAGELVAGQVNVRNRVEGLDILPDVGRWSAVGRLRQSLNTRTELFVDALWAERQSRMHYAAPRQMLVVPSTNPFYLNPTGGDSDVLIAYSFDRELGPERNDARVVIRNATAGATVDWQNTWRLEAALTASQARERIVLDTVNQSALTAALRAEDPQRAFDPFGGLTASQTLANLNSAVALSRASDLWDANLIAQGELEQTPAGPIRLATGMNLRSQSLRSASREGQAVGFDIQGKRRIAAAFTELVVPLAGERHSYPGLRRAEFSAAARFEDYNAFGSAVMPRVGLSWAPLANLILRGTWSHSFKAPALVELNESDNGAAFDTQPDPSVASALSNVLIFYGNNADLRPERAESWTTGLDLKWPSRRLSGEFTYFENIAHDGVARIDYSRAFLSDPRYTSLVTRDPSALERERLCRRAPLFFPLEACVNSPVAAIVDARLNNVALIKTRGFDASLRHDFEGAWGRYESKLEGTFLIDYVRAQLPDEAPKELVNTPNNPLDLRLRASTTWQRAHWTLGGFLTYSGRYTDTASVPARSVDAWTALDVTVAYRLETAPHWRPDLTIAARAANLFDRRAPFLNNPAGIGFDPDNAQVTGRTLSLTLRAAW